MSYTRAQYCKAVLNSIGNNSPSTGTINWMVNWSAQEDNAVVQNKHNLFNTTQPEPGSHGGGSQGNIMYYTSFTQGVQATATTLKNGLYPELLRDLQTNNTAALAAGSAQLQKDLRTWGTGYNSWYSNPPATSILQQTYQGSAGGNNPVSSGTKQWFNYPFANDYGGKEPFGNYPKPDLNIQCPAGTPVTAVSSGIVSGINSPSGIIPAWGASVTIRMDTPYNAIATHYACLHMQPIPASLRVGTRVNVGDTLGYAGSATAQGIEKVPLGFAFFNGDCYGYGATFSQYNGDQRLNPYSFLTGIAKSGIAGSGGNSLLSGLSVPISLAPNASVTQLLVAIDESMKVQNPFDTSQNNVTQDSVLGATFDDPVQWLAAVGTNTFDDTKAIGFRLVLFIIGAVLFYKVLSQFVDVGKVVNAGKSLGMLAAGV
jgi:Peptidase family M23